MNESLVSAAEEAARRSRRGYEYQDLVAASFCLEMLRDANLQRVACETQEDVVLTWVDPNGSITKEFIQVKSDRHKQQWSIAQFCVQDSEIPTKGEKRGPVRYRKDTSIFEKNVLRGRSVEKARYRMVTRADVNELRDLTAPSTDPKLKVLAGKLHNALKGNTTLTLPEIERWVGQAYWDVRGAESALIDDNFRRLADIIEAEHQRLVCMTGLNRLLSHLVEETRAMAMGKGLSGSSPDSVSMEELRTWLSKELEVVPHFLGGDENAALLREERESLARCRMLWMALGISEKDALSLAQQPDIGSRPEFFAELPEGFHWITATYGAGKSLAAERLFQAQVAKYSCQEDVRVPIFLRAPRIVGTLREAVSMRLRDLSRGNGSHRLFLIVDALDEAGVSRAHALIEECYELTATWPNSMCIATSADLPFSFDRFRKRMPRLNDDQAAEIVSRFAESEVSAWQVRSRLRKDHGVALMCVLLGQALRETAGAVLSEGELLHRVVEAAKKRNGGDASNWDQQADLLCRMAMLSTNIDGGPIRPTDLGISLIETTSLANTKLVTEEAGRLVFTVATMRLWFAAQALHKGWVDVAELVADLPRTRHWIDPLAIFIATTDFERATHYFEPLVCAHPAIAAQVISKATTRWGSGLARPAFDFEAFALRVRRCLQGWIDSISPLGESLSLTDNQGTLLNVRAGFDAPHTIIQIVKDPNLPLASALPSGWKLDGGRFIGYKESDEPSHLWRETHEIVFKDLEKLVKERHWGLVDHALFHEEVWNIAINLGNTSRWHAKIVSWDVIDENMHLFNRIGATQWLRGIRIDYPDAFPAPHPAADVTDNRIHFIPEMFSPEAALARAHSTYSMALSAYQRIVTSYFPNFRNDFRYSAWWPCRLVGKVAPVRMENFTNWWIGYHCEPVEKEDDAIVTLKLGSNPNETFSQDFSILQEAASLLRPQAPPWYWASSTALNLHESRPATSLVREWLLDDLKSAGWKS